MKRVVIPSIFKVPWFYVKHCLFSTLCLFCYKFTNCFKDTNHLFMFIGFSNIFNFEWQVTFSLINFSGTAQSEQHYLVIAQGSKQLMNLTVEERFLIKSLLHSNDEPYYTYLLTYFWSRLMPRDSDRRRQISRFSIHFSKSAVVSRLVPRSSMSTNVAFGLPRFAVPWVGCHVIVM